MKKLLLINPLTYIVLIALIALFYQLLNGSTVALFTNASKESRYEIRPHNMFEADIPERIFEPLKFENKNKESCKYRDCFSINDSQSHDRIFGGGSLEFILLKILEVIGKFGLIIVYPVLIAFLRGRILVLTLLGWVGGFLLLNNLGSLNWFSTPLIGSPELYIFAIIPFVIANLVNRLWLKKFII